MCAYPLRPKPFDAKGLSARQIKKVVLVTNANGVLKTLPTLPSTRHSDAVPLICVVYTPQQLAEASAVHCSEVDKTMVIRRTKQACPSSINALTLFVFGKRSTWPFPTVILAHKVFSSQPFCSRLINKPFTWGKDLAVTKMVQNNDWI